MILLVFSLLAILVPPGAEGRGSIWTEPDSTMLQVMDSLERELTSREGKGRRYNPNFITDYEAYLWGLDTRQLGCLRDFRSTGRKFRSVNELEIVLGWSAEESARFSENLYLPATSASGRSADFIQKSRIYAALDLNRSPSSSFEDVPGIGPVLANRIVRFREALGGFRSIDQLKDVYGLQPELAERMIRSGLRCSPPPDSSRIDLGGASPAELRGFPYFSPDDVERIVRYRSSRNGHISLEDLRVLLHFSEEKFNRISLYLYD